MVPEFKKPGSFSELTSMVMGNAPQPDHENVWGVYERLSRVDLKHPGYSLETQAGLAEKYARDHGAQEIFFYDDANRSGKNSARAEFQRLLDDMKAGRIPTVVFHRLDRLFRNHESTWQFFRLARKYGVRVVSVTEDVDTSNWWGRLVLVILSSLAEAYLWSTSANTRIGLDERRNRGKHLGRIPLGFCNGLCSICNDPNGTGYCPLHSGPDRAESRRGEIAVPHPIDRHVIPIIKELSAGGYSYREISQHLNHLNYAMPDGTIIRFHPRGQRGTKARPLVEREFTAESIRKIVRNPFYTGELARYLRPEFSTEDNLEHPELIPRPKVNGNPRHVQQLYAGQHEALISKELQQAVDQRNRETGNSPIRKASVDSPYLLAGIGRCWECYETLEQRFSLRGSKGGKNTRYYRCAYLHDHALPRAPKKFSRIADLNPNVLVRDRSLEKRHTNLRADKCADETDKLMSRLVVPVEWYELVMAHYLSNDGMTEFERESFNLRQSLKRQQDLYRDGHSSRVEFERQSRFIGSRLSEIQPSARPEAQEILPNLQHFPVTWLQLTTGQKNLILKAIFSDLFFNCSGQLVCALAHEPFNDLLDLPDDGMLM